MGEAVTESLSTYMRDVKRRRGAIEVEDGITLLTTYMRSVKRKRGTIKDGLIEGFMMLIGYMGLAILCIVQCDYGTASSSLGIILSIVYMGYKLWRGIQHVIRIIDAIYAGNIPNRTGDAVVKIILLSVAGLSLIMLVVSVCNSGTVRPVSLTTLGRTLAIVYMSYQIPVTLKRLLNTYTRV